MLVGTKCLESNAPGTFFVGWFLATPNISQVVYLAIAVDSRGFNPQNMGSKKQQKSLKKQTQIWSFCPGGFYGDGATEALNDDQCCSGSEASIISETRFCQPPSYLLQSFCQFNDKTLRWVPSMSSGVGIELIPRIIVLITGFGGDLSTAICVLPTMQLL